MALQRICYLAGLLVIRRQILHTFFFEHFNLYLYVADIFQFSHKRKIEEKKERAEKRKSGKECLLMASWSNFLTFKSPQYFPTLLEFAAQIRVHHVEYPH